MSNQLTFYSETAEGWERSLMAFLGEKQRLRRLPVHAGELRGLGG